MHPSFLIMTDFQFVHQKLLWNHWLEWLQNKWASIRSVAIQFHPDPLIRHCLEAVVLHNMNFIKKFFTCLERLAEPNDTAQVCVFLASDKSSYMTGFHIQMLMPPSKSRWWHKCLSVSLTYDLRFLFRNCLSILVYT